MAESKKLLTLRGGASMRRGSVLLMVLVVIAIGMVIYFLDMRILFGPPGGRTGRAESRPWLEEDLIKGADEEIRLPRSPKPLLTEEQQIAAAVSRDGTERGTMTLVLSADGRLRGTWRCSYRHGDQEYAYDADFGGNIDSRKVYVSDEGAKDKSLLYLITRGSYTQRINDVKTNQTTTKKGTIYVTGWLAPDWSARGIITITTDRKWSVTYDWTANR